VWSATVRHDIRVKGYAFHLRPAEIRDSAFILSLRTDPELSRFINPTSDRLEDQEAWMERYFQRPNDYYWMIVRTATDEAEGAVAIYDVDQTGHQAEWGRWVLRKGSLAAVESTLLVYRAGFDVLGLHRMYCHTVSVNRSVVSYHTSCGLETTSNGQLKKRLRGREYEHVEQYLTLDRWPAVKGSLDERASAVARLLSR
jgi:RimJ/RimL family protein N-acetyltransferase